MRDKIFDLCSTTKMIHLRSTWSILEAFGYRRSRVDTRSWQFLNLAIYGCVRKIKDGPEGEQTGCSHIANLRD